MPPQGFGPDGQNPRRSSRIREENSTRKNLRFFKNRVRKVLPKSLQGIVKKFARDCRNFVGGQRNTRRSIEAECLQEIIFLCSLGVPWREFDMPKIFKMCI